MFFVTMTWCKASSGKKKNKGVQHTPKECHFSAPKKDTTGVQPLHIMAYTKQNSPLSAHIKKIEENII